MKGPAPKNVTGWFRYASVLDRAGKEFLALSAYQVVVKLGVQRLPKQNQPRFYLQFGSTLRNCGRLKGSRRVLKTGIRKFPDHQALVAFLALTEYSLGNHSTATRLLGKVLMATHRDRSLQEYSRALSFYLKRLVG